MSKRKLSRKSRRTVKIGHTVEPRARGEIVVAMIRLRGLWLEHAGFPCGRTVEITVAENQISLVCRQPATLKVVQQGELF